MSLLAQWEAEEQGLDPIACAPDAGNAI
jgi:hypothetical protein